jgi:hypothetical protein
MFLFLSVLGQIWENRYCPMRPKEILWGLLSPLLPGRNPQHLYPEILLFAYLSIMETILRTERNHTAEKKRVTNVAV